MKLQFLTPTLHGLLDYAAAAGLIVLPFILNLGADQPIALWLSVAGGVGLIVYSLLTDYPFSVVRLFSYKVHLMFDLAAAVVFIIAPFVLGFELLTTIYYLVMAAGVIAVVGLSERPSYEKSRGEAAA